MKVHRPNSQLGKDYHFDRSSYTRKKFSMYNQKQKFKTQSMIHSSFTIDKTPHTISFGRQKRLKKKTKDDSYHFPQSFSHLNQRSSAIGYGKKTAFPRYVMARAKENPSPSKYYLRYNFLDCFKKNIESKLGKTFFKARRKQPNLFN